MFERDGNELTTAFRETYEETNLVENDLKVYPKTHRTLDYKHLQTLTTVNFWLAELRNPTAEIKLSYEHQQYKWMPIKEACQLADHDDMKKILAYYHTLIAKGQLK